MWLWKKKRRKRGGAQGQEEDGEETFYLHCYDTYSKCFGDKATVLIEKQSEWRKSCTDVKK